MSALLLLAAFAWAVATSGGTSARDMAVTVVLLGLGMATVGRRAPHPALLGGATAVLVAWLLVDGPMRLGWTLESVRVPVLAVVVVLATLVAASLSRDEREGWIVGLVVVACLAAAVAIGQAVVHLAVGADAAPRAGGLLGSPNALGLLLVAAAVLVVRAWMDEGRAGWAAALGLLCVGVIATGSRTALVVGATVAVVWALSSRGAHRAVIAAVAVVGAGGVIAWRTAAEGVGDRPLIWAEAWERFAASPIVGEGAPTAAYLAQGPGRPTAHAHLEPLQWGVEYGLVGLLLLTAVISAGMILVRTADRVDPGYALASLVLVAGGMLDFSLRITAIAVVAAVLGAFALTEPGRGPDTAQSSVRSRTSWRVATFG
ncbi:O-antigen ligase family protein [Demequina subtropica]|uniref:O-antigen ligase family protein n=1 Tax=Demequina subtropica TaxID=1638989 RepID=UPI0007852F01|nr:O-antigen ligase family protein [Demequina subtropica]